MENFLSLILSQSSSLNYVFAYIDPGTGSIILQAIIGAVVGAIIAVKLFWHRILKFLGIRKSKSSIAAEETKDKK